MFKKSFISLFILLFLVSCVSGGGQDKNASVPDNMNIVNVAQNDINNENIVTSIELKNGLKIEEKNLEVFKSVCNNLEGKQDYILEGVNKVEGKIEALTFIEDYLKEDKSQNVYNEFLSLKDGNIVGKYLYFQDLNKIKENKSNFSNKDEFYEYFGNYLLFLDNGVYEIYKGEFLDLLSKETGIQESPIISIILAEFYQNKSCSDFIKNNFY